MCFIEVRQSFSPAVKCTPIAARYLETDQNRAKTDLKQSYATVSCRSLFQVCFVSVLVCFENSSVLTLVVNIDQCIWMSTITLNCRRFKKAFHIRNIRVDNGVIEQHLRSSTTVALLAEHLLFCDAKSTVSKEL